PGNAATVDAGVNGPSRTWFIPEGNTTRSPIPFDTFLLLQNPNASPTTATVTLFQPQGALATPGATDPATTWFLAEGSTQPPFTEEIYILNPGTATMSAHIDFDLPGGRVVGRDFTVL